MVRGIYDGGEGFIQNYCQQGFHDLHDTGIEMIPDSHRIHIFHFHRDGQGEARWRREG
jgi:hypothetical protein